MGTTFGRLTAEEFRQLHIDGVKPHHELLDGEAIQKAVPTKSHAKLQKLLAIVLAGLGFYSFTELTLRVDTSWEPIPDVAATLEDFEDPYPSKPVEVVAEVLSPQDTFQLLEDKCERYAQFGIPDILVFDPIGRKVWKWNRTLSGLIRVSEPTLPLDSNSLVLDISMLWVRFESER